MAKCEAIKLATQTFPTKEAADNALMALSLGLYAKVEGSIISNEDGTFTANTELSCLNLKFWRGGFSSHGCLKDSLEQFGQDADELDGVCIWKIQPQPTQES